MSAATLAGYKTMTRRLRGLDLINEYPDDWEYVFENNEHMFFNKEEKDLMYSIKCPYGQEGDILWVRESYSKIEGHPFKDYIYKSTDLKDYAIKWKPSIHMPYSACRQWLKVKAIRVERLHSVSEADAIAEGGRFTDNGICDSWPKHITKEQAAKTGGLKAGWSHTGETHPDKCLRSARSSFCNLWIKINGQQNWDKNPFLWVVSFEPCEKPVGLSPNKG